MRLEIRKARAEVLEVLVAQLRRQLAAGLHLVVAGVHLERAHGRDQHRGVGAHAALAALDVEELLGAHVGAEARLGHDVVGQAGRHAVRDHAAVAVGDVREGSRVHEYRGALGGLNESRIDRIAQHRSHRAGHLEVFGRDRLAGQARADADATQARAQVAEVLGERQDRHDLGGRGDVEGAVAGHAVLGAAQARAHMAQGAVVDIQHPPPGHVLGVDLERIAQHQARVDRRREQVVGCRDRVKVSGQVQVDRLHRQQLRRAAAGAPALDAEDRAHRRLSESGDRALAGPGEGHGEPDGVDGLALPRGSRIDGRDQHVARAGPGRGRGEAMVDLRHAASIAHPVLIAEAEGIGQLRAGLGGGLGRRRHRVQRGWSAPGRAGE